MPLEIVLCRHTIVRALTGITLLLLLASVTGQFVKYVLGHSHAFGFVRLFYVDAEGNIPTFFSSLLLLLSSILLAFIAALKKHSRNIRQSHWASLSLVFLYMATDEAAEIHELLQEPGKWLLGQHANGIFTYTWIVFGIALVLCLALYYFKFYFDLPSQTKRQFFWAATIFLAGALGVELAGSYYDGTYGRNNLPYSNLATVEEGLEMAGVIVFINALLTYIQSHHGEVRLRFTELKERPSSNSSL